MIVNVEELQKFLLRGTEESAGKGLTFQKIWQFGYPFLMFLLIRSIAVGVVAYLYLLIDGHFPGTGLLIYDDAGNPAGTTGNGSAIAQIIGFVAGAAVVWKSARTMIREAAEDSRLLHIRKEPVQSYFFLAVASVGMMLGLYVDGADRHDEYFCCLPEGFGAAVFGGASSVTASVCGRGAGCGGTVIPGRDL